MRIRHLGEKGSAHSFSRLVKVTLLILCIGVLAVLRYDGEFQYEQQLFHFTDPLLALFTVTLCYLTLSARTWLRAPFAFVGKHSMNIFLTHTLLYSQYLHKFIFSFQYPTLIFLALLGSSLLLSVAIERLKEITRYIALVALLKNKLKSPRI